MSLRREGTNFRLHWNAYHFNIVFINMLLMFIPLLASGLKRPTFVYIEMGIKSIPQVDR